MRLRPDVARQHEEIRDYVREEIQASAQVPILDPSLVRAIVDHEIESDVQTDAVLSVLEAVVLGCPPSPQFVFNQLRHTIYSNEAFGSRGQAFEACSRDLQSALGILARAKRGAVDNSSDLEIVNMRLHQMSHTIGRHLEAMAVPMLYPEAVSKLIREWREIQRDICALNGKPLEARLAIAGKMSHDHNVSGGITVSQAYSSFDGGTDDLGALDAEFIDES